MVSDAEKTLRGAIQEQSKGQIVLTGFRKKDGREIDKTTYELIYEADLRFESSGQWMTGSTLATGIGFNFRVLQGPQSTGFAAQVERDMVGGRDVVKGGTAKISGSMVGQKFESGWKFGVGEAQIFLGSIPNTANPKGEISPAPNTQSPPNAIKEAQPQTVAQKPSDTGESSFKAVNLTPQAESHIRKFFEGNKGEVKAITNLVEYKVELGFQVELRFENNLSLDTPVNTISISRGDKARYSGSVECWWFTNGWSCAFPASLVLLDSSSPSLVEFEKIRSGLNPCINNLRRLEAAKEIWALENKKANGTTVVESEIMQSINESRNPTLKCPSGGVYSINAIGTPPACSVPGHSLASPISLFDPFLKNPFFDSQERTFSTIRRDEPLLSSKDAIETFFELKVIKAVVSDLSKKTADLQFLCEVGFRAEAQIGKLAPVKVTAGDTATFEGIIHGEIKNGVWTPEEPILNLTKTTAGSVPLSDEEQKTAIQKRCSSILKQIAGAKEIWALDEKKSEGATVVVSKIDEYITGGHPSCPGGGTYTYGALGASPKCSIADHNDGEASAYQCADNLSWIEICKGIWVRQHNKSKGDPVNEAEVDVIGKGRRTCPGGGTYTYGLVDGLPKCSIVSHNKYYEELPSTKAEHKL